jgi:ribulose-phosphate 3-epimerase
MNPLLLAPSILSADFTELGAAVKAAEQGGADLLHLDIMDGHFVPNISFGPAVVAAVRRVTSLPLDVHLMIEDPDRFLELFQRAGARYLTVHVEACRHLNRTVAAIRALGMLPGVSLNPATPLTSLEEILSLVELVLVMSVNPGFGGQQFIGTTLDKIERLRRSIEHRQLQTRIEVDGGIDVSNVRSVVEVGGSIIVAGSAVFGTPDIADAIVRLRTAATLTP